MNLPDLIPKLHIATAANNAAAAALQSFNLDALTEADTLGLLALRRDLNLPDWAVSRHRCTAAAQRFGSPLRERLESFLSAAEDALAGAAERGWCDLLPGGRIEHYTHSRGYEDVRGLWIHLPAMLAPPPWQAVAPDSPDAVLCVRIPDLPGVLSDTMRPTHLIPAWFHRRFVTVCAQGESSYSREELYRIREDLEECRRREQFGETTQQASEREARLRQNEEWNKQHAFRHLGATIGKPA